MINKKLAAQILFPFFFILLLVPAVPARAVENKEETFAVLQKRLIKDGFDAKLIKNIYNNPKVKFETVGVSLFSKHSESKLNYDQYSSRFSIWKAKRYMKKHRKELALAEKTYGVEKEIITAIVLVETGLGTLLGNKLVINTFSSTASLAEPDIRDMLWNQISDDEEADRKRFDEWADRKSKWGYTELKAFLQYTSREKTDPVSINGSYAGAIGIAQFIPSSVVLHAKDGNNDGRVDLFNHADAAASIANYLKNFGWESGITDKKASEILYMYNHSNVYVQTLLKIFKRLKG